MKKFNPDWIKTVQDARNVMANAHRNGDADTYRSAFRRMCEVAENEAEGELDRDVMKAIAALEQLHFERLGRKLSATTTRKALVRNGAVKLVGDLATRTEPSEGFERLIAAGLPEFTFEAVLLKHETRFEADAVTKARTRLEQAA